MALTLFQVGCATKYIVPGNRFMTPESQGGVLNSSVEFQQPSANQLTADVRNGSVEDGVITEEISRTGFSAALALLEPVDLFWTHTGGGNSLLGAKYQFLGPTKAAKGAGHKMAISAAFGGNEHETDTKDKVEFKLNGQEFQLLYGYRFSELILMYANWAYASYDFSGEVSSSDSVINGLKPEFETRVNSIYTGLELNLSSFFVKAECGYQQLKTTDTKDFSHFIFGYALGLTF